MNQTYNHCWLEHEISCRDKHLIRNKITYFPIITHFLNILDKQSGFNFNRNICHMHQIRQEVHHNVARHIGCRIANCLYKNDLF